MSGMPYTDLPSVINSFRGFGLEEDALKYLFYNMSYQNKPSLYGKFSDGNERRLELEILQSGKNIALISPQQIKGIKFLFSLKDSSLQEPEKFSLIYENNNTSLNFDASGRTYKFFNASFISANKNESETRAMLSDMIIRKEEGTIIKMLQDAFGDSIIGIRVVGNDVYFDIKDIGELVSINIMGEGVKRFLNIISAVFGNLSINYGVEWLKINPVVINSKTFVCIDEIENGLHYSIQKNLWKGLLSAVSQSNIQLFITTHNIEVLSSLTSVLEEDFTSMQNEVAVFDIERTKKVGYMAYRYSYKGFMGAIENEIEIRD
jgi:AAA15 family ATPase/GTPase